MGRVTPIHSLAHASAASPNSASCSQVTLSFPKRTMRVASRALSTGRKKGFFELRADHVLPGKMRSYLDEIERTAVSRKRALPGLLGMWKTEIGGSTSVVSHLYHWESFDERDKAQMLAADEADLYGTTVSNTEMISNMTLPLPSLRDALSDSTSMIMNEATACLEAAGLPGALAYSPPSHQEPWTLASHEPAMSRQPVAFEMRKYQLQLGYSTVPTFLELYGTGLQDKLAADDSGASELCTLLYSDCGSLNVVIEIWRHRTLEASLASRQASRKASKWRAAVEEIAGLAHTFETAMMRPVPSSPWC